MKKDVRNLVFATFVSIASFFYLMLLPSCKKGHRLDCFKSNGSEVTVVRYLAPFKNIKVSDKIELYIVQGNEYKVEITAGKNIVENITTEMKDTVLLIENTSRCNFVRGYKRKVHVKVTLPYLAWVGNYGVGSVRLDENFCQDSLLFVRNENSGDTYITGNFKTVTASSHGNGDIYLTGSAQYLNVYMFGTNFTHAEGFTVSETLNISNISVGDAHLNLNGTKRLEYYIWKSGSIYYSGEPQSIVNLGEGQAYGKGRLLKQ